MKSIIVSYTCCETTSCHKAGWDLRADTQGVGFEPLHSTDPQIVKMGNPFSSVSREIKRINLCSSTSQCMVYGSWTSQQHGKKSIYLLEQNQKIWSSEHKRRKKAENTWIKNLIYFFFLTEEALADTQKMKANLLLAFTVGSKYS